RFDPSQAWQLKHAGPVLDPRDLEAVLEGISLVHVADRAVRARDDARQTRRALAADAGREARLGADADLALPLRADPGEIVGEVPGRPATVAAEDGRDLQVRKLDARVDLLDRAVIPLRDVAEIDVREDLPGQPQSVADSRDVVGDRRGRKRPRDLLAALTGRELVLR